MLTRLFDASGDTMSDVDSLPDFSSLRHARNAEASLFDKMPAAPYRRKFIIFAGLLDRALGDFVYQNLFAASVSLLFDDAELVAYYRDDRPYKKHIVRMNPHIGRTWRTTGTSSLPFDYFDTAAEIPVRAPTTSWYKTGSAEPDLVLAPSMMQQVLLPSFPTVARLRIPEDERPALHARLLEAGLDPDRWFCVLHYREPGYAYRSASSFRDFDPAEATPVCRHLIEALGGQVVRIGHPGMTPLPAMSGYVDLAGVPDGFMLQSYAISRARFFLELSPSGPMALAGAFGVPMARCNQVVIIGPLGQPSFSLVQHVLGPDGRRIPLDVLLDKQIIHQPVIERTLKHLGYRFQRNSARELLAAADEIHRRTTDCAGWRDQTPQRVTERPNSFAWPMRPSRPYDVIEYPELAPDFAAPGN